MKNKIKSYSFWVALSGSIVIFVNALGELFGFSVQDDLISGLIMAFAGILVVLGIVTMPKDNTSQEDEKQDEKNEDDSDKPQTEDNIGQDITDIDQK